MSIANINENSSDKEKLQNFLGEIKYPRNFRKKLTEIYLTEFDEKFDQILLKKDSEFMNLYLKRVRTILEDMYSNDCFENEDLGILMKTNEIEIYEKHYKLQFKLLNEALLNYKLIVDSENSENIQLNKISDFFYDDDSMTIREININEEKESTKILKEKISNELAFRKHCRFIEDVPRHFCKNGNSTNFIKLRSLKQNGNITHVICSECKMAYKSNCVLLYCNFCSLSYFSSIDSSPIETPYLQPATWEKYHCSIIVNDQMRCIRCKDPLFFDLKENLLKCFNDKCNFESEPYSIYWTCVTCKNEFQSNAKIYNPLEYKLVKSSIKEALIFKKPARPKFLPCCQDQVVNDDMIFYHKKECYGRIFFGTMQNRQIIVCEKCRSLSNYDRYIWTCPSCGKRFKNKSVEKNTSNNSNSMASYPRANKKSESGSINNISKSINNNLKCDIMVSSTKQGSTNNTLNIEMQENNTPISNNTKEMVDSTSFSNKSNKESLINNPSFYKNCENNNMNNNNSIPKNLSGNNSFHSINSNNNNNTNSNKIYIRSNTSTNNYKDKSEIDLKNYTSSNNSENAENSLKSINITASNSIKIENEIKEHFDEDSDSYFNSNSLSEKDRSKPQSCNSLINIKESKEAAYDKLNKKVSIRLFKSSKTLKYNDNEIESNPVSQFNSQYKNLRKTKVTFDDESQRENKKIIKLISSNKKEIDYENKKDRKLYTSNKKSKSTVNFSLDINDIENEKLKENFLTTIDLVSIENQENESKTQRFDLSIHKYGFTEFNIDDYTIDLQIGEGAYGNIYKIHDEHEKYFALKKNIVHDNNEIPMMMKEYIIMNKLKHPFILDLKGVTLKKLDLTTTSIYVLMDLAENDWGKEIKKRSQDTPKKFYTEEELILILKQLSGALTYMQKMNVAHRDLKPHNILIFENFIHKIADFGETQFLKENLFGNEKSDKSIERKGIRGTELFMSPKLYKYLKEFKNDSDVIHNPYKSDCYSLGLCILNAACLSLDVLYELRGVGIENENEELNEKANAKIFLKEIFKKQIEGRYSKDFENLLMMMLSINERERPDFIELERILQKF
jgi:ribosomal protein L37AE/L43A